MKKKFLKKSLVGILSGTMLFQMTAFADVDKLNISQMIQAGNDVYLYVNTLDDAGRSTGDTMSADQLSVTIDKNETLPVQDAVVSQTLNQGMCYSFCIDISKSITEAEMQEIKSSISAFADRMSANDYAKIITIGSDIQTVCDYTQDRSALKSAAEGIERTADYTYLYKGLSFALDGQRKAVDTMPDRAAVIVFTDGMDDSDGASNEDQVLIDIAETRIPVYVVGLKGQDSSANLNSAGQIARQSGGSILSYNDMSITEALQAISDMTARTYQLHVTPENDSFGKQNLNWRVTYNPGSYSVVSSPYVYSLGMDGVVMETELITEPQTELVTETETEPPTEPVTEPVTEPQTEPEPSGTEKLVLFLQENIIICVAAGLILVALIILLVTLLKKKKKEELFEEYEYEGSFSLKNDYEKTLDEKSYNDNEATIDEKSDSSGYDDNEETVYGDADTGVKLEFEITFDGHTEIEQRVMRDQLVLGRGNECDVDVVLKSNLEDRKQTSRKHAFIIERPDGLYVKDNSKNKTYLNGMEVAGEMALKDDDVLQLGRATVKIRILSY